MKRQIVFDASAANELRERRSYFGGMHSGADRDLMASIDRLLELICEFPHLHEAYGPRLRRAVLPRWSLGLFYRSTENFILVAAIIDLRRDPAAIRRRLGLHEDVPGFSTG